MPSFQPRPDTTRFCLLLATGLLAWSTMVPSIAADRVTRTDGEELTGSVFSLGPDAIEIETEDGGHKLSVTDYRTIVFDGEPPALEQARQQLDEGDPTAAAATLAAVLPDDLADADRRIREEHAYLTLLAAARAAEPARAGAAAAELKSFLERNPRSHHAYAAWETLGDVLARQGRLDEAAAAFRELDGGPPALQVRAAAARGRMLAAAGRPAEALRQFESAARIPAAESDSAIVAQQREAALGLARCLAATGKPEDGMATVRRLIEAAEPDDEPFLAAAYAALGACQRAGGRGEDALISFLAVDLVYDGIPAARAEALANLVELWQAANQPERARAARAALQESYPDSAWAVNLAPPAD